MKTQIISFTKFIDDLESKNLSVKYCDLFIDTFIYCNPNRKDMSRADWLSILHTDYNVLINDDVYTLEPKQAEPTIEIFL